MTQKIITVFGGSGFIGSSLVIRLAREGFRIRVAVRNTDHANHLRVCGEVGQVMPIQVPLHDKKALNDVIKDAWGVVNLLGTMFEKGSSTFDSLHINAAKEIATFCAKENVARLLHISALGASTRSPSNYAQSKARGEKAVEKAFPDATILRPSVIFGPGDQFLNQFAKLARILPFLATFENGQTKLQPVYVGDVAEALISCLKDPKTKGKLYELGGPEVYTLKELMTYAVHASGRNRKIMNIPTPLGMLMAHIMNLFPNPLITPNQIRLLTTDNVVHKKRKGFKHLGMTPCHIEAIAPSYLSCYQKQF